MGGRNTADVLICAVEGSCAMAGWTASRCCAANGTRCTRSFTANAHGQRQPFAASQSQSSCCSFVDVDTARPGLSHPWALVAAVPETGSETVLAVALLDLLAICAAIWLAFHNDAPPSRQNATINRQRSASADQAMSRKSGTPRCSSSDTTAKFSLSMNQLCFNYNHPGVR